jgi:hypothetical protein
VNVLGPSSKSGPAKGGNLVDPGRSGALLPTTAEGGREYAEPLDCPSVVTPSLFCWLARYSN